MEICLARYDDGSPWIIVLQTNLLLGKGDGVQTITRAWKRKEGALLRGGRICAILYLSTL